MPPHEGADGLTKRDLALARVDLIMSDGLVHRPQSSLKGPETLPAEVEPVNIDEAVESPPSPAATKPAPIRPQPAPKVAQKRTESAEAEEKKSGFAALHWFFQTLILLFVLAWVFLLGIFIGRGYLMETQAGRELIGWIEETIGWHVAAPEISVEKETEADAQSVEAMEAGSPEVKRTPPEQSTTRAPEEPPVVAAAPSSQTAAETAAPAMREAEGTPGGTSSAAKTAETEPSAQQRESGPEALLANSSKTAPEDDSIFLTPETLAVEMRREAEMAATVAPVTEETPPQRKYSNVPPTSPTGGYAVQATYALNEQAAKGVIERLERQGFPAYYYKNSRNQYLVRVGRFESLSDAENVRDKLSRIGYKDPYISRLEPDQ
ncbi:hypothetical protein C4J81_05405 [Deltaproteobacteria bacterium Smac51]|nr:hypothetical protein C4J81_05405 [Deltaproteobacteria bacterium Smac51]